MISTTGWCGLSLHGNVGPATRSTSLGAVRWLMAQMDDGRVHISKIFSDLLYLFWGQNCHGTLVLLVLGFLKLIKDWIGTEIWKFNLSFPVCDACCGCLSHVAAVESRWGMSSKLHMNSSSPSLKFETSLDPLYICYTWLVNDPDFLHPCTSAAIAPMCIDVHRCQEVLPLMRRARCNFAGQPDVPSISLGVLSSLDRSSSQDQNSLTSLFHNRLLFNSLKNVEKCWKGNEVKKKNLGSSFCFCGLRTCPFTHGEGTIFCSKEHMSDSFWYLMLCPYSSAGLFKYVEVSTQKKGWWSQFWLSRFWGIVIPRKRSKKGETYHCFCKILPTTGLRLKSVTQAAAVSSGLIIVAGGYDAREAQRLGSVSWQIQGVLG